MNGSRRDFLKGTAWMGLTAFAAGCMTDGWKLSGGGTMQGYADESLKGKKLRVGVVGLGMRGPGAAHIFSLIPGVELVALCDLNQCRIDLVQKWLKENGRKTAPKEYAGPDGYKRMCESDIDFVYNATPWQVHVEIAMYAMEHGKHVATEVPTAFTLDQCWQLVETSERTRRHCIQLENCCYGEIEMLTLNMARMGLFGELKHAECAYIHDLRECCYQDPCAENPGYGVSGYWDYWRLKWNMEHKGNQYPTHGLGPVSWYFDINRGDRFDYLVSLESQPCGLKDYATLKFGADSWKAKLDPEMGDMNTTLVKTVKGKSIMIQHDVSSPRPYSRINLVSGTRGILKDYPYQVAFSKKPGDGAHEWFKDEEAEKLRKEYMHPLWKEAGDFAKVVGGHGGMDFLMILRLCYCLQNGLPVDMDVYDLAAWCSICELSERSVRNRSASIDVPDFTRGGWKSAKPVEISPVGLAKMGFKSDKELTKDTTQLSI